MVNEKVTKKTQAAKNSKVTVKDSALRELAFLSERELMMTLRTSRKGLSADDAAARLETYGLNQVSTQKPTPWYILLLESFKDPFVYVLLLLMTVSILTKDYEAAVVMGIMVLCSAIIRFVQEYRSQQASEALKEMIENTCTVIRDNKDVEIPMDEVVPGDIVKLSTGDMIPADAVLIWTKDLFVNQSSLTGESLPVEKFIDPHVKKTDSTVSAIELQDLVFMGTDVLSGQGLAIILKTGRTTFFGDIAKSATTKRINTAFDKGMANVSKLLIRMVMILFPIVFLINGITKGDWSQAFFFAIAVAVGLTPEMLPMIVTSNMAKGAIRLSRKKVIVKELPSIQNLGGMDILCTDKTGTITEDRVVLVEHVDPLGNTDDHVLNMAYLNSNYQTGWKNLMDHAVISYYQKHHKADDIGTVKKIDEIPFDFSRRRLTVAVENNGRQIMVTKGAVEEMGEACQYVEINGKVTPLDDEKRRSLRELNQQMNQKGMRVLALAVKYDVHDTPSYTVKDESGMTLIGFMGFLDPAKPSAKTAIKSLHDHGVLVKVLTGDNEIVAQKVCSDVGIDASHFLLGVDIDHLSDEDLKKKVDGINLFAKLNPLQKARLIACLQSNGHTVGFMGDGINDAPALRKADVGISVDTAADITKEASSIILLEKSLDVLKDGVLEGRKVFINMMKYIKMTISSNFGNVFSILIASAFLPFLPMLSIQLLVQNLIYDVAQLMTPWDNVDEDELNKPVKWEPKGLVRFTIFIGPVSSIFDIVTFAVMWYVFHANTVAQQGLFQAGWFIVGLLSQTLVVHVLRTRKIPFVESSASNPVIWASIGAVLIGILIVITPLHAFFDFLPLPGSYWIWMVGILFAYLLALQIAKKLYIHFNNGEWL